MSMPIQTVISCSLCDFSTNETILWGNYQYAMSNNAFLHISRIYGWCYACKDIRPVEAFPDKCKLEQELETIDKESGSCTISTNVKSVETPTVIDGKMKEIQMHLQFLNVRKDPPRCLTCGSTDIAFIDAPYVQEGEMAQLVFKHPDCGGTFTIRNSKNNSSARFAMRFPLLLYSVDGRLMP